MKNFNRLLRFAKQLELKYLTAQNAAPVAPGDVDVGMEGINPEGEPETPKPSTKMSAQAADIEDALKKAGLWDLSNSVSPLLNQAKVPDSASVSIKINVKPGPSVSFTPLLNPVDSRAASALSRLLLQNFSTKMMTAIKNSGLDVADLVVLNWLTF